MKDERGGTGDELVPPRFVLRGPPWSALGVLETMDPMDEMDVMDGC